MNLNKKRIGLVTAWLISLMIVATVVYVVYAQTASTFWITEGIYPSAPNYTIWRENSDYYAKNAYGEVDYSGTNETTISQQVVNSLTSGGSIYYTSGIFLRDAPVHINQSNLLIYGSGDSSIIRASANWNVTEDTQHGLFWVSGYYDVSHVANLTITKLHFDADYKAEDCILVNYRGENIRIYDNLFENGRQRGVYVTTSHRIRIESNTFLHNRMGVYFNNVNNSLVNDNHFRGSYDHAVDSWGDAIRIIQPISVEASNNIIEGLNEIQDGIEFRIGEGSVISNNIIVGTRDHGIYQRNINPPWQWTHGNSSVLPNEHWINVIEGNTVSDTGNVGIEIANMTLTSVSLNTVQYSTYDGILASSCLGVSLTGNTIRYSTRNGIFYTGNYSTINGNTVINNDYANSTNYAGIRVSSSTQSMYNTLTGNTAFNYASNSGQFYGIHITSTGAPTGTIVLGCTSNNAVSGANILDEGTNSHVNYSWNGTVWIGA